MARATYTFRTGSTILQWVLFTGETWYFLPEVFNGFELFINIALQSRNLTRPKYSLIGDKAPSVDILITCCGEDVDVIMDTVAAAHDQDYPADAYRVFVLDDGYDAQVRAAAEAFNNLPRVKARSAVIYLARKATVAKPLHFKAGNLRFGIDESKKRGASEFVAGLDADMIMSRGWLRCVVPHLVLDPGVAMVNPPQVN